MTRHFSISDPIFSTSAPRRRSWRSLMLICALLLPILAAAAPGYAPVRNFYRDEYGAGPQNWAVEQDSTGSVYVGNRNGMLTFDGQHWQTRWIAYGSAVRSLHYDHPSDRIYAGGSEEFGYFAPDIKTGKLHYHSLMDAFINKKPNFSEIWNIFRQGDNIWFQGDFHLFCYDGRHIHTYPTTDRISKSALIGNDIIIGLNGGKLVKLNGSVFEPIPNTELLRDTKIVAILPLRGDGSILIATANSGLFTVDDNGAQPLDLDISQFLKDNQVFCGASERGVYIFGTVMQGAVLKNLITGETRYINKENGLQNNTVLNARFDRAGNVWLCLDNGLDYAAVNSPVTNLIGPSNDIGAGYASLLDGNRILFGTNQGLFSTSYPFIPSPLPVKLNRELQGQVWSITKSGDDIFVAADTGIFVLNSGKLTRVAGVEGAMKVQGLLGYPDMAIASTYQKFHLLKKIDGRWTDQGPIKGYDDIGGQFILDSMGGIWLSHWRKGIYRLHLNVEKREFDSVKMLTTANGLPSNENNVVMLRNGKAVFTSAGKFMTYSTSQNRVVPYSEFSSIFGEDGGGEITTLPNGSLLRKELTRLSLARRDATGRFRVDSANFRPLSDLTIPGFIHLNHINGNEVIVSNQEGFWNIDMERTTTSDWRPQPFVSAVYANRDSLVYRALPTGVAPKELRLSFDLNSLRFDFAYPDFTNKENVKFSSYLENYDTEWSPWSAETTRDYTRLKEGTYIMHLRTIDALGNVQQSQLKVVITPPWYRSMIAYLIYFMLIVGALAGGFVMLQNWHRRSQQRLSDEKENELNRLRKHSEQEALKKDYEIATLKSEQLENEIRNRSQELSNTTMNLVRKNEILHDIAEKIEKIQTSAKSVDGTSQMQKQLGKIRNAIEDNIKHDEDWKVFTRNFDIVYENYTKRLMELHPSLSSADLRMCCYIKMGLSSKEIAPLVNISYKSVEMARYRLRKKMNLPADITLSDYLAKI